MHFPTNIAKPFSGIDLYSLNLDMIVFQAHLTFLRLEESLMFTLEFFNSSWHCLIDSQMFVPPDIT